MFKKPVFKAAARSVGTRFAVVSIATTLAMCLMAGSAAAQSTPSPATPPATPSATPSATQSTPAKKELVAKILLLQQPSIEGIATVLAQQPAAQMMQGANVALQSRIAPDKREAVAKEIQADIKKYVDEAVPLLRERAVKLAPSALGPLLEERFSEDELKQLIAIMESPVNRKYGQMNGELQKALGDKLVTETRSLIEPKVKVLDASSGKRLGLPLAAAGGAAASPAGAASAKPQAKPPAKAASK